MRSTKWNSEIRMLFRETQVRYPHQQLEADTQKAYLEDWRDECERVGWKRFEEGVKRARAYCKFFPLVADIRELIPEPSNENLELHRQMADWRSRKAAGEKFYTLADVLLELCNRVEAGKIRGRDELGNKRLREWAKNLRGSEKRYAAKMLAEQEKRGKSDFQQI